MPPIQIINPDLIKQACCGYGAWFALDMLVELWVKRLPQWATITLTKTCPSCGAKVTVNWNTESVTFVLRENS